MNARRSGPAFLALLIALMSLSGCWSAEKEPPVQITLMHGWGASRADHVAMRRIYDDFGRQNPDIRLLYDASPDISVVMGKARDMLALDEMPGIISTNGHRFVDGARRKGLALDLAPYLDADPGFAACVSPVTLNTWRTENGEIYTLSDAQELAGYWYNADILRAAGVTDTGTPEGKAVPPTTWDAFWAALSRIQALSEAGAGSVQFAALTPDQCEFLLGALLAGSGEAGLAFMKGEADACPRADWESALGQVGRIHKALSSPLVNDTDARKLFCEGRTAFYFNGVWAATELAQLPGADAFSCAAFPGPGGRTVSFITPSSGYVIGNTGSKAKIDACVRFLRYMLSVDVQRRIVAETQQAPSNPQVTPGWIAENAPVLSGALNACYNADEHIIDFSTLLNESINLALDDYFSQSMPSDRARSALLTILSQNGVFVKEAQEDPTK